MSVTKRAVISVWASYFKGTEFRSHHKRASRSWFSLVPPKKRCNFTTQLTVTAIFEVLVTINAELTDFRNVMPCTSAFAPRKIVTYSDHFKITIPFIFHVYIIADN